MQSVGSVASIVAAVREDAAAEAERIEQQTAAGCAALRAEGSNASVALLDRDERLAAARRAVAERLAAMEWEGRRAAIQQREEWITRVVAEAQKHWPSDRATLSALARDALQHLPPVECELAVAPDDAIVADAAWCAEIARTAGKPSVRVAVKEIGAGCVASSGDVSFDNSFASRSRRLESRWRTALGKLYSVTS